MNSERHKIILNIEDDFSMKHAKMLLSYQTYLLYDVQVNLRSSNAYKSINYFLKRIDGRISHKFFRKVEAHADLEWIEFYKDFMKRYIEMSFKITKIHITLRHNVKF